MNRLLLLSFVINMSDDPTCPRVGEDDIATKLRIGLPYDIGDKVEQHMQLMVDLERKPDVSPWGIAAIALKVEARTETKLDAFHARPDRSIKTVMEPNLWPLSMPYLRRKGATAPTYDRSKDGPPSDSEIYRRNFKKG